MIDNLMNIEQASKILLGAHHRLKESNPLDYVMNAMGVKIESIDQKSKEFEIINSYCIKTWPENPDASRSIKNIFKLTKFNETHKFDNFEFGNKWLLFHGS